VRAEEQRTLTSDLHITIMSVDGCWMSDVPVPRSESVAVGSRTTLSTMPLNFTLNCPQIASFPPEMKS
jgi:hypothetical protein